MKNVRQLEFNKFLAGNLSKNYLNWKSIKNYQITLDIIKNGLKVDSK